MDGMQFLEKFGLPGLLIGAIVLLAKVAIAAIERGYKERVAADVKIEEGKRAVELERIKVEDKKAEAMISALNSLSGKIDQQINAAAHNHAADIQSHQELGEDLAYIRGQLDGAEWLRKETTHPGVEPPTRQRPNVGERAPRRGTHHDGDES